MIKSWDILILVPYEAQYQQYLNRIAEEHARRPDLDLIHVVVEKVDRFQGSEAPVVIFDCTVTNDLGFAVEPGRLNTSLSRAKNALYVIGDEQAVTSALQKRNNDYKFLERLFANLK